jgi:hypothetical protein
MPEPGVSTWTSPDGGYFADDASGFFSGLWQVASGTFDRAIDYIELDRAWDYRKWMAENSYSDSTQLDGTPPAGTAQTFLPANITPLLIYGGAAAVLIYVLAKR